MKDGGKTNGIVRFAVLIAAVAFIAVGLLRQEQAEVFGKAVRICLECIGIG